MSEEEKGAAGLLGQCGDAAVVTAGWCRGEGARWMEERWLAAVGRARKGALGGKGGHGLALGADSGVNGGVGRRANRERERERERERDQQETDR